MPRDPQLKIRSYETVVKRWPVILTGIIDNIYRFNHDLSISLGSKDPESEEVVIAKERIAEGKNIIETISKLKYEMGRDRTME